MSKLGDLLSPGSGPPLREVGRETGWYPLVILTTLNVVDELDRAALAIFAPNIKRYFGINNATLGGVVAAQVLAIIVLGVPIGYLGTKINRANILRWSAAAWSAFSFATAFCVTLPLFLLARVGAGVGKAAVEPVGRSLLTDYYPPTAWNRILAIHGSANSMGSLLGPALAGGVALFAAGDGIWRWAFPVLTVPTIFALVAARRLDEPPNQTIRTMTGSMLTVTGAPSGLTFKQAWKRLYGIPTFKSQLVGIGVLGFALVGALSFFNIFLEEHYKVDEGGRALIGTLLASASLLGSLIGGNVGERIFERDPERATSLVGASIAAYCLIVSVSVFLPNLWLYLPVQWIGLLAISVAIAPLSASLSAISPPRLRPLMFSMLGLFIAVFGGVAGGVIVGAIADATNAQIGLASIAPFGVVGGLLMSRAGKTIKEDMANVEKELLDS